MLVDGQFMPNSIALPLLFLNDRHSQEGAAVAVG